MKRDDLDERLATWIDELLQQPSAARWNELNRIARENPSVAVELRELFATAVVAEGLAPELWGSNPLSATLDSPAFAASSKGDRSFPRSFGSYVLLEELGRGGMGVVYKAEQTRPHRIVALKMILRAELATAVDRARFRAETESGARLEHPHIVSVYEVGEIDERPYFSMQYIEGSTLARRLADGPQTAIHYTKLNINTAQSRSMNETLEYEARNLARCFQIKAQSRLSP